MKREDFKHLDLDYGMPLPRLVLAIKAYEYREEFRDYSFKPVRKFLPIAHQTAGHGCHQHYLKGTVLIPRDDVAAAMQVLNDHWLDTDCGCLGVSLDEVLEYRQQLQSLLHVDCNLTYRDFEEGIYPMDYTLQTLSSLQIDEFPQDLDELIEWQDTFNRTTGFIGRWQILILGENCD
jgi:hypothetical protein